MAKPPIIILIPHSTKTTIEYEAKELPRCKDCKWNTTSLIDEAFCHVGELGHDPDWFCADGEWRDQKPNKNTPA